MSPCRTLQLLALSAACACAAAVNTGCSDAVVADREQQKIESSPEAKRQQREAAERGAEALEGMENAFDTEAAPQPDDQTQPDKPPEETPQ